MFDVRTFRTHSKFFRCLFLLCALAMLATAQTNVSKDKDKDKDRDDDESKKSEANGNFVKIQGKARCDKAAPSYSIEVPDRPGHALLLSKRKCTWTEPMEILGDKTKDGIAVSFAEKMEGSLHTHGFETDTFESGEKLTWQNMGQVTSDKAPTTVKGRWSLMRGTGKFKGIKGGGTYEGQLAADDVLTLELEGVFDPSGLVGEKK